MERESKAKLTTEQIKGKFKSQFDLVNYAIRLAENMIKTGRETRVKSGEQNRAMQILAEIAQGMDVFDDIPEPVAPKNYEQQAVPHETKEAHPKTTERKKARKILADF